MVVDLYLVYSFIKRLATPFSEWPAFKYGIIDEKGNILKPSKTLNTIRERESFGLFDRLVLKIKRLLEKVPGGATRIGSYAAALWLIKEHTRAQELDNLTEEAFETEFTAFLLSEDAPVNAVGSGQIAGTDENPPKPKMKKPGVLRRVNIN
jgi:hypothetical protein